MLDLVGVVACVVMAFAFAGPMLRSCHVEDGRRVCEWVIGRGGSTDDWRMFSGAWESARVSLVDFHQWPSWNPWHCGGVVLYQDPQAPVPGPLFVLTFAWLPTVVAMKVWLLGHLIAGALGVWCLLRREGAHPGEGLFAATMVTACGFCAEHFGGGHLSFAPFLLFPWVLYGLRRSLEDARWSVLTAALLAAGVFSGATYPLPLMAVGVGLDLLVRLRDPSARRAMLVALPLTAVLFVLLAGVRLLPVLAFLQEHPRLMPLDDAMTVAEVVETWVLREHPRPFPGHVYVWPEYGNYIGVVPVAVLALALLVGLLRRDRGNAARLQNLFVFAGLLWCALGNIPGLSLFGLLHELPVYRSLRVPSRFLHPTTVLAALAAGLFLVDLRKYLELRAKRAIVVAFVVAECALGVGVAVDVCANNAPRLQQGVDPAIPTGRAPARIAQDPGAPYWRWPTFPVAGVGSPTCYAAFDWEAPRGLWFGEGPQQRVMPEGAGAVVSTSWSPNVQRFEVTLSQPGEVWVNQHWDSGWQSNVGDVVEREGLVALSLGPGRHAVELRHRPRGLAVGALFTALGVALSALLLRRWRAEHPALLFAWLSRRLGRAAITDARE